MGHLREGDNAADHLFLRVKPRSGGGVRQGRAKVSLKKCPPTFPRRPPPKTRRISGLQAVCEFRFLSLCRVDTQDPCLLIWAQRGKIDVRPVLFPVLGQPSLFECVLHAVQ